MEELVQKIIDWGEPKGLTQYRKMLESWPQYEKVQEESGEIGRAIAHGDMAQLADGIGDTFVTLVLLAKQNGLNIQDCVEIAYGEIKDRKGKTVNGVFIKEV